MGNRARNSWALEGGSLVNDGRLVRMSVWDALAGSVTGFFRPMWSVGRFRSAGVGVETSGRRIDEGNLAVLAGFSVPWPEARRTGAGVGAFSVGVLMQQENEKKKLACCFRWRL